MNDREILQAVQRVLDCQCEGETLEVKSAAGGTPKVYDSLSSFSNQDQGGMILFGISESDGFQVTGVANPHSLQKDIAAQCLDMEPPLRPEIGSVTLDGKQVVGVRIVGQPRSLRPVYRRSAGINKGSYVRVGDADVRMSDIELYDIFSFKNSRHEDSAVPEESSRELLDETLVNALVLSAAKGRPQLQQRSHEEVLELLGVTKGTRPTTAGLLVACPYPQRIFPNLSVVAIRVDGVGMGNDAESASPRFIDNKTYEGTIADMVDGALGFVRMNTATATVVEGVAHSDIPEYPEVAVREILLNALMHRDYGPYSIGTPVRLSIFDDRLECWSPGKLYGGQSLEEIGLTEFQTRNQTLVRLLEIIGLAENRHSGVPSIRSAMEKRGLPEPIFEETRTGFRVTLYNGKTEKREAKSLVQTIPETRTSAQASAAIRNRIVDFCKEPKTRAEIAAMLGKSPVYVSQRYIRPMVVEGLLTMTLPDKPRSPAQKYQS